MRKLDIGNVTITSVIERDGPWRRPEDMFPAYDPDAGRRHLAELDPEVFDPVSGRLVITYQTCGANPETYDFGGHLHRGGQGLCTADGFPKAAVAEWIPRCRA